MAPSVAMKPNLNGTNHVNGTSDEEFHTLVRHPLYYIQAADLFFLLRNVQFRVHRYFFERESAYFRAKLSAPASPGAPKLGSSENEPIVLTDVTPTDFEKLLWVFYNPYYSLYPAPAATWSAILALAHKWGLAEVKDFCVRELQKKTVEELGDIDRIVVYHDNDVDRNLLIPVYAALCAREQSLTLPEGLKLGMETTLVIASAREYVRGQVMADGSRTPITPNVEGEEMEKIIRNFFGIPIPEGSSTSVHEVQAAMNALSIPARTQNLGPPPKLNVKTTNEPSGARPRNARPPSPPQPLSQPQQDPSQVETPSVSMLQVPAQPPKKKPKSSTKKTNQLQPQPAPTDLPVSIIPPTPTQEKEQQELPNAPKMQSAEQHPQDDQNPPLPNSKLTQEVDPTPQPPEGDQGSGPSLPADGEKEIGVDGGEEGGKLKGEEPKYEGAEAEKAEASMKGNRAVGGMKGGEAHEETQQGQAPEEPAPTTAAILLDQSEVIITQNLDTTANANPSNDTEAKPDSATQPPAPDLTTNTEQPASVINSTSAEETKAEKDNSQDEPVPAVEDVVAGPTTISIAAEPSNPSLPPFSTSSKPTTSPVISTTPLADSPRPGSPKPLSRKKRKALADAAKKVAEAEAQAAEAKPQPTVAKEPETVPAPEIEPECLKTPPTEASPAATEPLKLKIDKTPFVPEVSDVGTPTSEQSRPSTPGTPTVRLSKKHRKALSQLAKKNAAEKVEQEAAAAAAEASPTSDTTKAAQNEESKKTEKDQTRAESKQEPSGKSTYSPIHPSNPSATSAAEASRDSTEGTQQASGSGRLIDATTNGALAGQSPASDAQPKADASMSTTSDLLPPEGQIQSIQDNGTSEAGTAEKAQSAESAEGQDTKDWESGANAEDASFTPKPDAQPEAQTSAAQPSTDDASKTETSAPFNRQPNKATTPQTSLKGQEQEIPQNLPPKPSDGDHDHIPLALKKSKDSLSSSGKGHRSRLSSNSNFDPMARRPSGPAHPQSPAIPFSPTSTGHSGRSLSSSSSVTPGGRPSLNERMAQQVKGPNVNEKAQQSSKKSEESVATIGKTFKSWFG